MSEKEQQFERIYKETESFGRTQFVREIQMQINENKELKSQLQQKENITKEVRKYIDKNGLFTVDTYNFANGILKILDRGDKE